MSRLTETVVRRFARLENTRFGGDAVAGLLGFIFFSFTVGIEKLDPRNVGWLTFGDQKTHLLGWQFFAADQWRWPLGANPMYGWEGKNSIVYTDSWPGLALFFKALVVEAVDRGQYFGLGLMIGAIALFIGARRLFWSAGIPLLPSLVGSGLLGTTSVFWWMQRWYPALSAGLPILVWALYFYVDDAKHPTRLRRRWMVLLSLAAATHAYLTITAMSILGALLARRLFRGRRSCSRTLVDLAMIGAVTTVSMYVLGYFTLSSKWAQTGGYGWYSSNVLGLIDSNEASRFLPDIPSISGQYEPTALGIGTLLLLVLVVSHRLRFHSPIGITGLLKEHLSLVVVLFVLSLLSISNTVSIASWSYRVPLPERLEHGLSIFRSSARFIWPTVIVTTVVVTSLVLRRFRYGVIVMSLALAVQIIDSTPEALTVALSENGGSVTSTYDARFWTVVPEKYTSIVSLPAQSHGFDWEACAWAAVSTGRSAECGYFSRVQGLDVINRTRSTQVLTGVLEGNAIYMVSGSWLAENRRELLNVLSRPSVNVVAAKDVFGFRTDTYFLFPECPNAEACAFLGDHYQALDDLLLGSNL